MAATLKLPPRTVQRGPTLSLFSGLVLLMAVLLAHAWLMNGVMDALIEMRKSPGTPERVQVRYVREMTMSIANAKAVTQPAPPVAAPPTQPPKRRRATARPNEVVAVDSSAVEIQAQAEAASGSSSAQTVDPATKAAAVDGVSSDTAALPTMASAPTQEPAPLALDDIWPQTTRVRYTANGYYRGEVNGHATVEWVRQGDRYQMHMDVTLGLGLFSRTASSRGRIGLEGVSPERYDELTNLPFRGARSAKVILGEQAIEFAQGNSAPRVPGVQDTASQFVQLTYLFTTQPELAGAGQRIEFPLAFPRGLRGYAYQVQGRELLQTPIGLLDTVHVTPRRIQPTGNDLVAQAWFAPAFSYFPVRIRLSLGEENFIDLLISKPPDVAR